MFLQFQIFIYLYLLYTHMNQKMRLEEMKEGRDEGNGVIALNDMDLEQDIKTLLKKVFPHNADRLIEAFESDSSEARLLKSGRTSLNLWFKNVQVGFTPRLINKEYEINFIYRDEEGYFSLELLNATNNLKIDLNFRWG